MLPPVESFAFRRGPIQSTEVLLEDHETPMGKTPGALEPGENGLGDRFASMPLETPQCSAPRGFQRQMPLMRQKCLKSCHLGNEAKQPVSQRVRGHRVGAGCFRRLAPGLSLCSPSAVGLRGSLTSYSQLSRPSQKLAQLTPRHHKQVQSHCQRVGRGARYPRYFPLNAPCLSALSAIIRGTYLLLSRY